MSISKSSSIVAPGNRNSHPDYIPQSNDGTHVVDVQPGYVSNAGVPQFNDGTHVVDVQPGYVSNAGVPQFNDGTHVVDVQPGYVSNAGVPQFNDGTHVVDVQPGYVSNAGVPQFNDGTHVVDVQPSYVSYAGVPQPGFAHPQPGGCQPGYVNGIPVPPDYVAPQTRYPNKKGARRGSLSSEEDPEPAQPYEDEPEYCCCYINEHDPRCCVSGKDCNGQGTCSKPTVNLGTVGGKITCGGCILIVIVLIIIAIVQNKQSSDDKPATAQPTYAPYRRRY